MGTRRLFGISETGRFGSLISGITSYEWRHNGYRGGPGENDGDAIVWRFGRKWCQLHLAVGMSPQAVAHQLRHLADVCDQEAGVADGFDIETSG